MTEETLEVAQLVIRTEELNGEGYRYFLAKRTKDSYWEWIGGKRREDETIQDAAVRELKEEIRTKWSQEDYEIVEVAESYPSQDNPDYRLYPVLIDVYRSDFSEKDLSEEHDKMAWIELEEFDEYDTLGQINALKKLDIVKGDTVVAAVECPERNYLLIRRSKNETMTGKWEFPGGMVDQKDSSLTETVLREVEEETGMSPDIVDKKESYIGEGATGYWLLHPFTVEVDPEQEVELSEEHDRFEWICIDGLEDLDTVGDMKAVEKLGLK